MRSVPMQQEERHLGGDSGCGRASARDYLQGVLDELDPSPTSRRISMTFQKVFRPPKRWWMEFRLSAMT